MISELRTRFFIKNPSFLRKIGVFRAIFGSKMYTLTGAATRGQLRSKLQDLSVISDPRSGYRFPLTVQCVLQPGGRSTVRAILAHLLPSLQTNLFWVQTITLIPHCKPAILLRKSGNRKLKPTRLMVARFGVISSLFYKRFHRLPPSRRAQLNSDFYDFLILILQFTLWRCGVTHTEALRKP